VSSGETAGRYAAGMRGEVPYHDPRELIGDVPRFGKGCEVVAPAELRETVAAEVKAMAGLYGK